MATDDQGGKAPTRPTGPMKPAPRGSLAWLHGLICGGIVTLATPSALLLGIMLAPVWLAYRLDREAGRPVARVVFVCALAGALHPLRTLWLGGHAMPFAVAMLGDVWNWLPAWIAGAAGWVVAELAPIGLHAAFELGASTRAARLRAQRAKLESEWGIAPAATTHAETRSHPGGIA